MSILSPGHFKFLKFYYHLCLGIRFKSKRLEEMTFMFLYPTHRQQHIERNLHKERNVQNLLGAILWRDVFSSGPVIMKRKLDWAQRKSGWDVNQHSFGLTELELNDPLFVSLAGIKMISPFSAPLPVTGHEKALSWERFLWSWGHPQISWQLKGSSQQDSHQKRGNLHSHYKSILWLYHVPE